MANIFYNSGLQLMLASGLNWHGSSNYYIMLTSGTAAQVGNKDHGQVSLFSSYEVSGSGYSRRVLSGPTSNPDGGGNDTYSADAQDITWSGITAGTIRNAVIYRSGGADTANTPICYIDTGGFPITTNGGDITLQFNTAGIFVVSGVTATN